MELLTTIVAFILGIYLIIKLNPVLTTGIKMILKTTELGDASIEVYSNDVHINLAKKRNDQMEELQDLDMVVTSEDIHEMLFKKPIKKPRAKAQHKDPDEP